MKTLVAAGLAMMTAGLMACLPGQAWADTVDLGTAGNYVVFGLGSTTNIGNSADPGVNDGNIYGNVGVGADTGSANASGNGTFQKGFITGNLDVDTNASYTIVNKNFTVDGTVNGTVPGNPGSTTTSVGTGTLNLQPAVQDAINASAAYGGLTVSAGNQLGAINLNSASLALNAGTGGNNGTGVYSATSLLMNSGALLTIHGGANDVLILNVSGSFSVAKSFIQLTGGITADHVLFNVIGDGNDVSITGGNSVFFGTVLDVYGSFTVHDIGSQGGSVQGVSCGADGICGTSDDNPGWQGRLIGALNFENGTNVTNTIDFASGGEIDAPAPVPEPATLALLGSGLVGLGILGRKRLFKQGSLARPVTPPVLG